MGEIKKLVPATMAPSHSPLNNPWQASWRAIKEEEQAVRIVMLDESQYEGYDRHSKQQLWPIQQDAKKEEELTLVL